MTTDNEEREYTVTAKVTISITKTVSASSAEAAKEAAKALAMPGLCHPCASGDEETWDIGYLDGEACHITVEE